MEGSDKNRFIKQYIELYGEEFFLKSSLPKTDRRFKKLSKKSLLSDVEAELSFHFNHKNDGLNGKQVFGSGDINADLVDATDHATVLGVNYGLAQMAADAGTIGYEILTQLGQRPARRFKGGQKPEIGA